MHSTLLSKKSKIRYQLTNFFKGKPLFALIYVFTLFSFAYADYFDTESAWFEQEGRVNLVTGIERFNLRSPFGNIYNRVLNIPLEMNFSMIKNVQLNLQWPLFFMTDPTINHTTWNFGDIYFGLALAFDDLEYNFKWALTFNTPLYTQNNNSLQLRYNEDIDTSTIYSFTPDSTYPMTKGNNQYSLGYRFSKEIGEKFRVHFNADYVYELLENETIVSNLFSEITGFIQQEEGSGGTLSKTNVEGFSPFGLDKIFRKLFWLNEDLQDPYKDRKNDHIELSLTVDSFHHNEIYLKSGKRIPIYFKPFLELSYVYRFTQESLYRSHLTVIPGFFLKYQKYMGIQTGIAFDLWGEENYFKKTAFKMNFIFTL